MTLAPLATLFDLAKAGVTLQTGEQDLATRYLEVASAAIRQAARVPITQVTSTVEIEGTIDQWLRPPGVPVISVGTVAIDDVVKTDYVLRSGQLWRAWGWSDWFTPSLVTLTDLVAGLPDTPIDIVDLACRMVVSALVAQRSSPDGSGLATTGTVRQETLGDYSVTYASSGMITEMQLPSSLAEQLAARFGGGVSVVGSR